MKTDNYTKIVLTIIAVALTINVIKGMIPPAMADTKKYSLVPVNADGSINVKITKGDVIDVNIQSAANYSLSDAGPLRVTTDQ